MLIDSFLSSDAWPQNAETATCPGPVNYFSGHNRAIWACRQYCCRYVLGVFILCYLNSNRLLPAALTSMSDGTKLTDTSQSSTSAFKANTVASYVCHCVLMLCQLVNLHIPDAAACAPGPSGTRCQWPACCQLSPGTRQSSLTWWMAAKRLRARILIRIGHQRPHLVRISSSGVAHLSPSLIDFCIIRPIDHLQECHFPS